tara:strand:+ start:652 stop:1698 length:1047 start_codon:yes stop_codon:yes gene_type:complete
MSKKVTIEDIDKMHIEKHGCTFHASYIPDVRCHIDKATVNISGDVVVVGWVFSDIEIIDNIRIALQSFDGSHSINSKVTRLERSDVMDFYKPYEPSSGLWKIGFKITCTDTTNLKVGDQIILECNTKEDLVYKPVESVKLEPELAVNDTPPALTVIDNFYSNPDAVRELALQQDFEHSEYHKGKRTSFKYCVDGTKEKIEKLLGLSITDWDNQAHNMVFQYCTPADPLVYHYDGQTHAAVVFLTPDAPSETGTSFFRHKKEKWLDRALEVGKNGVTSNVLRKSLEERFIGAEHDDFLDGTKWEEVDRLGNKYNRFAMWDAKQIHAASKYFGNSKETGRLFHMFFFNAK